MSGPYHHFGTQAARALRLWAEWDTGVVLDVVDDEGSPARAAAAAQRLGRRADLLLGPYSTVLASAAARAVQEDGGLLWNHGGSGSHVERGFGGHVVSVLTPTPRYAEPFLAWFATAGTVGIDTELWIAEGAGRFARQVARGAADRCTATGIAHRRVTSADLLARSGPLHALEPVLGRIAGGGRTSSELGRPAVARPPGCSARSGPGCTGSAI